MSVPRDHHFIPAFYLRQWTGADGKLLEYSKKNDRVIPKRIGPDATGFERDLYAFHDLPPELAQHVEQRFFDYADRVGARALNMLLAGDQTWTRETRSGWSRFLIAIHLRHPDAFGELTAAAKAVWESSGEDAERQRSYEKFRKPNDPATFAEYLEKADPLASHKMTIRLTLGMIDNELVGSRINEMHWEVFDVSNASHRLLTSDRPVEIDKLGDPVNGTVSIPISPTKLFVAANSSQLLHKVKRAKANTIVVKVNEYVVGRARRYVWAHTESQERFVERNMSKNPEERPFFRNLGKSLR